MRVRELPSRMGLDHIYIMHLSYDGGERERLWNYAKENNLIGLDAPMAVTNDWGRIRESAKKLLSKRWVNQFDLFCGMNKGDIVLVLDGWDFLLGIGKVTENHHHYEAKLSAERIFFDHIRRVRWIVQHEYNERFRLPRRLHGFNNALTQVRVGTEHWLDLADTQIELTQHIALKCTYNNGDEGALVGFNGTCSEDIIKLNIESGRVWCSQEGCECRKYYDGGFKGKRPVDPCYESVLFREWQYGAGWYHTGSRKGKPMHFLKVEKRKIAVLTTRFPGDSEEDRRIIGFFRIGNVGNKPGEETNLIADRECAVRLPMEEAKELFFWDYYSTKGGARWGTGLHRYLSDNQISQILQDLRGTLRDSESKEILDRLLARDFPEVPSPPSGPRIKESGDRTKRITVTRKYGSGGEGIEHKKLKEWVAKNPESIGLVDVKEAEMEYVFPSGDTADIVFSLPKCRYAVVEIETTTPLPGCYQALKYRTLKCAELGLPITSSHVKAILVAWLIPEDVRHFCVKYGISFKRKKI